MHIDLIYTGATWLRIEYKNQTKTKIAVLDTKPTSSQLCSAIKPANLSLRGLPRVREKKRGLVLSFHKRIPGSESFHKRLGCFCFHPLHQTHPRGFGSDCKNGRSFHNIFCHIFRLFCVDRTMSCMLLHCQSSVITPLSSGFTALGQGRAPVPRNPTAPSRIAGSWLTASHSSWDFGGDLEESIATLTSSTHPRARRHR